MNFTEIASTNDNEVYFMVILTLISSSLKNVFFYPNKNTFFSSLKNYATEIYKKAMDQGVFPNCENKETSLRK